MQGGRQWWRQSLKRKKGNLDQVALFVFSLARPERFELPTPWFVAKYSIQMSYGRVVCCNRQLILR